ncbi:MAG TPA: lysophospholipid acyltransferase family protein [Syntrophobacteria bacterium]|nr:lysophospholipid acyltransferase family protein [Syntrophobacteria bacterium]
MNSWGQSFGSLGLSGFLQSRLNVRVVRWMPFRVSRAYLNLIGRLYYALNQQEREELRENLGVVMLRLQATDPMHRIVSRTFRGIFTHYCEKLFTAYADFEKVCRHIQERVQLQGTELLDQSLTRGRGLILVTGHFGGVEFLPSILALKGYPVTMVVRFKTERLRRALLRRAEMVGMTLLDAGDGQGILFTALQALKTNRVLITECDEFRAWRPAPNQWVEFLGCSCPMDRTLDLLHRRCRSPVLMGLTRRVDGTRYQLSFHGLTTQEQGLGGEILQQRALRVLEGYIRETPDQWYQWKNVRTILGSQIFGAEEVSFAPEGTGTLPATGSAFGTHKA